MPRKKNPPKEILVASPESDFLDMERVTNSEIDIEEFLDEYSVGTSVVEIYEMRRDGSRPHMERVTIDILKVDLFGYLREHFGGGKYMLQFKDANRRIRKSIVVDVGGPKANPSTPGAAPTNTLMEQVLLALIAAQKPPAPTDMGSMLTGMAAMLQAMKPAATSDPAAMLAAMAQTFQQLKPSEGSNVKQALDLISAAKDLVPGGSHDGDSWAGLVKEGITTVASVLKKPDAHPAIPPGAQPLLSSNNYNQVGNPNPPAQEKTPDMILQEWLQAELAFLKTKAQAGKDVDFWVDYIMENQDEPGPAAILEASRRGATFQHLLQFDPDIRNNPLLAGWFQKLYEALHSELHATMDTVGPGGDVADPPGDAEPGEKG